MVRGQVQTGLVTLGAGEGHFRVGVHRSVDGEGLVGLERALRGTGIGLGLFGGGFSGGQVGAGGAEYVLRIAQLFAGHRTALGQRLTALEVQLGALQVGAGRNQLGIAACLVSNAGLYLGLQAFVTGQITLHATLGARQFGFSLCQIQGGILVVQFYQNVSTLYLLGVDGQDFAYGAADFRGDLRHFNRHIGIVSADMMGGHQGPVSAGTNGGNADDCAKQGKQLLALGQTQAVAVRGIGGGEGLDIFAHDGSLQLLYSVGAQA